MPTLRSPSCLDSLIKACLADNLDNTETLARTQNAGFCLDESVLDAYRRATIADQHPHARQPVVPQRPKTTTLAAVMELIAKTIDVKAQAANVAAQKTPQTISEQYFTKILNLSIEELTRIQVDLDKAWAELHG